MAKTPKKPANAKSAGASKGKPVKKPVKKAVEVDKLDEGEQQTYKAKDKDIDLALHRCLSHFGDFQPSEVLVVIKLLKPYYMKYGMRKTSGGIKFG